MALAAMITACNIDNEHFKIEGRLLNINQGELYVYSEEGAIIGIDTIKIEGGRFVYQMQNPDPATIMLVFPNFSEQPIFTQPGKTVKIKGDASHLKELQIKGTKDNELMTDFRMQVAKASPQEVKKLVVRFVEDHPQSPAGVYLVKKYFILSQQPDYKGSIPLIEKLRSEQPRNGETIRMLRFVRAAMEVRIGGALPSFTAKDTHGRSVSASELRNGIAVIHTWASWSYDSMDLIRQLKDLQKQAGGKLKIVSVSVDADKTESANALRMDSISWPNICDGQMFESAPVRILGMSAVPDNILTKDGKIIAKGLTTKDLIDKLKKAI